MNNEKDNNSNISRREFFRTAGRAGVLVGCGGMIAALLARNPKGWSACNNCPQKKDCRGCPVLGGGSENLWQIDPEKCVQCGRCATGCVLTPSATKCVHSFAMCGYCELCTGFFEPEPNALNTGAENQLCPVGAITRSRTSKDSPYFEYTIDEDLCIGCGKCVAGCGQYGNGSLYLQIKHNICKHCNECALAVGCPSGAISHTTDAKPYLLKNLNEKKESQ